MGRLDGKVALITGAARGQGRSHAICFAQEGADVILWDIGHDLELCRYPLGTEQELAATADACRASGVRVTTALCDVRDAEAVQRAVDRGVAELGRIDALLNNAGISSPTGLSNRLDYDQWRLVLGVNLDGPFNVGRAVANHMIDRGGGGAIVNTSSVAGMRAFYSNAAYVASKHGLVGLTRAMAVDLAPHNIRANAICPGTVRDDPELDSRMMVEVAREYSLDSYEETFVGYHLLPTLVEARDVSRACVWLACDDGARVTGAIIPVDAGMATK
jgi:SDR family mycofactocin-dependent oxidoreductase